MLMIPLMLSLGFSCDIDCFNTCSTQQCKEVCHCISRPNNRFTGFEISIEQKIYIFQDTYDSEIHWIQHELGCDLLLVSKCREQLTGERLFTCAIRSGCRELITGPYQLNSNVDDTDCIVKCTDFCQKNYSMSLDACFSSCLKEKCKKH